MTRTGRRWRLALGSTAVGLAAATLSLLPADTIAAGSPTGTSPLVYVAATNGQVDAFTLSAVAAGGTLGAKQSDDLSNNGQASAIAISRGAKKAIVVANEDGAGDTTLIDTSSGTAGAPFAEFSGRIGGLAAVSADPANGKLVYELTDFGDVYRVNIVTQAVTEVADLQATLTAQDSAFFLVRAQSLAVRANGNVAYVGASGVLNDVDGEGVLQFSLQTPNSPVAVWSQPPTLVRGGVTGLALTPSGAAIFGCDNGEIFGLHLPISSAETPFDVVAVAAHSVTVGPHGANVYAGVINANDQAQVVAFRVKAPSDMSTVSLETSSFFPTADPQQAIKVAEDPSGKTLLVTATLESDAGALAPFIFDVSLPGFTAGGDPIMNVAQADALPVDLQLPAALAITPDQAPHAAFTENLARAGDTSTFDAANSTVMYGSINSYKWNFGDGTPTFTTTGDTTTHVFQATGTYTVTLIEQDSEGTSIPPAFPGTPSSWVADGPGQTPYRLSSPLAETTQTVTITTTTHPTTSTTTTTTTKTNPKHGKKPFLSLEPTVGTPGTVVTVTGIHFPNNAIVTIEWSTTNAAATAVKVKVHNGGFVVQLLVLVPDLLGPRKAVALTYKKANRPGFLVVAGSDEPGGSDASPVFRSEGP